MSQHDPRAEEFIGSSEEVVPAPGRAVRNILAVWRQTGPVQREQWRIEDRQLVEALEQLEGEVDALNNPEKLL